MRHLQFLATALAAAFSVSSCLVENDMSYPQVPAEILAFEVDGQRSVEIDAEQRTVTVELTETADISELAVTRFVFSEAALCEDLHEKDVIDLSSPMTIVLSTYQRYEWTVTAVQPIERYIDCSGQIYDAAFDTEQKSASLKISDYEDVTAITFNDMKLEQAGSTILSYREGDGDDTPFGSFPLTLDCSAPVFFTVENRGQKITWTVSVALEHIDLFISDYNAWARRADISAMHDGSEIPSFSYRAAGSSSWIAVPDDQVVDISDYEVTAAIGGLEPGTSYSVRVSTSSDSVEGAFMTEEAAQLHNMSFDDWYMDGKAWMPNLDNTYRIWDSANKGSSTFNIIPTSPTTDVAVPGEGKMAAKLETLYAVVQLAAGNLYTGQFGNIEIGNKAGAILDWGVPFTSRPAALTGYYKYSPVPINRVGDPYKDQMGKMDVGQIMIFITDWDEPFEVNTLEGRFVDLENDPGIIAFGLFEPEGQTTSYRKFRIDLEYRDMVRKPKYIVITACASRYGNYFTGGVGSTLFVDEFELVYE